MFAKSRMFWNVRPMPARTMSLGLALRKMPSRIRRRWYQSGRAIAARSIRIRARRVTVAPRNPTVSLLAAPTTITLRIPTTKPGVTHRTGSSQARMGRATIVRLRIAIRPEVGS